jgi:hypothetical protein
MLSQLGSLCDLSSNSIHQHLHKASCLPEGERAPFQSAILQSNAMMCVYLFCGCFIANQMIRLDPKNDEQLQSQFDALCRALKLQPYSRDILDTLRDPVKVPWTAITKVIESDALGIEHGIFRACRSDDWIPTQLGLMDRQRSGKFARGLRERGVQSIVVGEVSDEWYIHSVSHPMSSPQDCHRHLNSHFSSKTVRKLMCCFREVPDDADLEATRAVLGQALSCVLTHFPVRLLHRELLEADFPVIRYRIEWTPEQLCPNGRFDLSFIRNSGFSMNITYRLRDAWHGPCHLVTVNSTHDAKPG